MNVNISYKNGKGETVNIHFTHALAEHIYEMVMTLTQRGVTEVEVEVLGF